jgi:hypothetical protein
MFDTYRVPYLQLDDLIVYFQPKAAEFNSDSYLMLLFELVVHDSLHEARLSYTSISNYNKLKEVILSTEGLVPNYFVLLLH